MSTFIDRLNNACAATRSLVCVGLDPDPARMPLADVFQFNRAIVDATTDLVCAYKPNLAFYEALGIPGMKDLARTVDYIHQTVPTALVIGDAKRGDIGPSAAAYARALYQVWNFDAVTVNPWGGLDTVEPFLQHQDRGVFIWCRGSNPGAADLQDLAVGDAGQQLPLYQHLAQAILEWATSGNAGNIGLVVGATVPQQLAEVRRACPDLPFLVPGVGAQGGDLEAAVSNGVDARGRLAIINSSRGIIYASGGDDFPQAARREAARLRRAINHILELRGKPWP
jgi:orotidine-5'-phosphate decarboxylase